ncbi:S8 family serine peptidase [Nocardioides sp. HM23]|uniref:S8 family peptidase n=1 Tax=Nocardioides bizhenqiangii TaxID=3095076 RepID=UPI002ACA5D1D|nr:S8 family serine peptidase [Nocardioides sp. HM23]MDZ5619218.1 S8 family serine peptidase [Nocardioides sp. HM23]
MSDSKKSPILSVSMMRRVLLQLRLRLPWIPSPAPDPTPADLDRERLRIQIDVIRRAFRESGDVAAGDNGRPPRRPKDDGDAAFLFRPGHALVADDRFDELDRFFGDRQHTYEGTIGRARDSVGGLALVTLPARRDDDDGVLATLDDIDDTLGRGVATPDHVLYVTLWGRACPATEPEEPRATDPFPPLSPDTAAGRGINVSVVDTGWWKAAGDPGSATPWLSGVVADPSDEEIVNQAAIHEYAGHGTFVSGVVRCMAPGSRVEVEGFLTQGGAIYESDIFKQLNQALTDGDRPHVISISAGTHTRWSIPLLSFELLARIHQFDDPERPILVVAAAGNDSSDEEFYPAAFDWVVGVGSVDADGKRSDFSNYGDWVNIYARGRDLVNAFPNGTYSCHYPENIDKVSGPDIRHFKGIARWSGTSFSTPIVSGLIAAHMTATGNKVDARAAYADLTKNPQTGPGGEPIIGPL